MRVTLQQHEGDQEYDVLDVVAQRCRLFRGLRESGVQEPVRLSCDVESFELWLTGLKGLYGTKKTLQAIKVRCDIA